MMRVLLFQCVTETRSGGGEDIFNDTFIMACGLQRFNTFLLSGLFFSIRCFVILYSFYSAWSCKWLKNTRFHYFDNARFFIIFLRKEIKTGSNAECYHNGMDQRDYKIK